MRRVGLCHWQDDGGTDQGVCGVLYRAGQSSGFIFQIDERIHDGPLRCAFIQDTCRVPAGAVLTHRASQVVAGEVSPLGGCNGRDALVTVRVEVFGQQASIRRRFVLLDAGLQEGDQPIQ